CEGTASLRDSPPTFHSLSCWQCVRCEISFLVPFQIADVIEVPHQCDTAAVLKEERGGEAKRKLPQSPPSEHKALQNWHRNMAIRKKQERCLGEILQKPENELLMSSTEGYRQIQEERDLIDRGLPALFPGKGYRAGSEFWSQPERIGDELTGLTVTLTRRERGCPPPVTHVGKPHTIQMETGVKPPKTIPFRLTWDKSLFLKHRRQELKSVLEELDFYKPDEVGIAARLTFETVVGEKAESFLTVSNDGTAAVCYNWRRLLQHIPSRAATRMHTRCFYFDARPGVILPGETQKFFFLFKSERAGVFSESWELRTCPLLLGGALLQVTLWGIAVCEDKLADLRGKLEADLAAREGAAIVQQTLKDLLLQIRTPERTPSPVDAHVTEEELFLRKNPKLHYQHQVVEQLQELWRQHVAAPAGLGEEVPSDGERPAEIARCPESGPVALPARGSTAEGSGWKDTREVTPSQVANVGEEEPGPSSWNFSLQDLKQVLTLVPRGSPRILDSLAYPSVSPPRGSSPWRVLFSGALRGSGDMLWVEHGPPRIKARLVGILSAQLSVVSSWKPLSCFTAVSRVLCCQDVRTSPDLLEGTFCGLQLWREAVDELVSRAVRLRSQLGLPERDTCVDALPQGRGTWWLQHSRRVTGISSFLGEVEQPIKGGEGDRITGRSEEKPSVGGKEKEDKKRTTKPAGKEQEERPSSRKSKVKEKKQLKACSSSEKEAAQPAGAAHPTEPPREQLDPIWWGMYQEKLYVEVYGLLDSVVSRMVSLFEELEQKSVL
ncbi:UNVERIFIED_CONTAM: hypothetical protein H355_014816, partial [Colinus virginianus]